MTAANYLTSTPELRERYDVTVYQQGWQLGGKGATGRDPREGYADRIYEHGLHMWLGWYHNAFETIQNVYAEWNMAPNNPFKQNGWKDAFEPQRLYTLQQNVEPHHGPTEWHSRSITMPQLPGTPGQGTTLMELAHYLEKLLRAIEDLFRNHSGFHEHRETGIGDVLVPVEKFLKLAKKTEEGLPHHERVHDEAHAHLRPVIHGAARLRRAQPWADDAGEVQDPEPLTPTEHSELLAMAEHFLEGFQRWLGHPAIRFLTRASADLKWYWEIFDFMAATGLGIIRDVIPHGVASINSESFHNWIGRHGADRDTQWCALTRAVYNLAFAFEGGVASNTDPRTAKFEAGTALMVNLRVGLGYKDAPMFRMMAGMGDTIFTPLYEVLAKQRGVKFEFFKRVTNLALSPDKKLISEIELDVQAKVKGGPANYHPLFNLRFREDNTELPVWPNEPLWDQLEDGPALKAWLEAHDTTLNSAWCDKKVGTQTLVNGVDFDYVVLGISVAGVKLITPELSAASPAWADMVDKIATVQTRAVQLWTKPELQNLGWTDGNTIQTTYAEPLDTWAVMTDVLRRENWAGADKPHSLHYFCGPLDGPAQPPLADPTYPRKKTDQVKSDATTWLNDEIAHMWPDAVSGGTFDYDVLTDPEHQSGVARLDSQYFRANVDPSERYVNSFPNTSIYRLRSDQSGFLNLFLAGDWTISSVNGGCVEAAVESGMAASRGICGVPSKIVNYPDP